MSSEKITVRVKVTSEILEEIFEYLARPFPAATDVAELVLVVEEDEEACRLRAAA